ncbi:MAG: hypothetical protein M3Y48_00995 [Actinomycetota bacterium]|nr:hypothetical protein [Actinomycetota bacterium]
MGLYHAIDTLAADWDSIRAELSDDTFAELLDLVAEFVRESVPDFAGEIAEQIAGLLSHSLPMQHPFRRALSQPENRWSAGATTSARSVAELTSWLRSSDVLRQRALPDDPLPTMDDIMRGATEWLLAENAFSEAEMLDRGQNPRDPDLIRLDRENGGHQWPSFQFDDTGLLDLVRQVNRILNVRDDPWGVADWWLGGNVWLRGVPAELIGQIDDQDLIDAALGEQAEA